MIILYILDKICFIAKTIWYYFFKSIMRDACIV